MAQASGGEMPPLALTAFMSSNSGSVSRLMRTPAPSSRLTAAANADADGVVEPIERQPFGDAEAQPGERGSFERHEGKLLAGHHRVGLGAIGDARGDRPDRIERVAQRKGAVGRHPLPARLEADQAA